MTMNLQLRLRRVVSWLFSNPWSEPRFLVVFCWAYVAVSLVPIGIAILFSFNSGRSVSTWQGFSLAKWYVSDPVNAVATDPALQSALLQTLKLAGLDMLIATPIGVALAIGIERWRGRGNSVAALISFLPMVMPELVMGVSLFLAVQHIFTFMKPGTLAQLAGHVTVTVPYIMIVVRSRLVMIGRQYEEAAADLGANFLESLWYVLLPLLLPSIFAGGMIAFAVSVDDFVISQWLSCGAGCDTVPVRIYAATRGAPLPSINALATVMVFVTLLAVGMASMMMKLVDGKKPNFPRTPGDRS